MNTGYSSIVSKDPLTIFWFRRDLRLDDNAGLYRALKDKYPVLPLFIFDTEILDKLQDKRDARVLFIYREVEKLKKALEQKGSSLLVLHGKPEKVFEELIRTFPIGKVICNRDYEPAAIRRDREVYQLLEDNNIEMKGYKDQVVFDKREVLKSDGNPYTVYTPYMRKWKSKVNNFYLKSYPVEKYFHNLFPTAPFPLLTLSDLGFIHFNFTFPDQELNENIIRNYDKTRDIPGIEGTSRLSIHLRFGTLSIRELMRKARDWNEKYYNELIWRDFYQSILYHFPKTTDCAFRPEYDEIRWENDEDQFDKWCNGKTGFPLVDAGMRELNESGYMHNRVRMLVASFLTKHLLTDWRWGEAYFAQKLLDYDQASNIGGWQWAAGCGVDAAPYFRIFNPELQLKKFDPDLKYVKKWIPEYGTEEYPKPVVDHKAARERALERYKEALQKKNSG